MDSQWSATVTAWNKGGDVYVQSFHFTFPPESAIVQISLSTRADFQEGGPYRLASAYFTDYTTSDGTKHDLALTSEVPSFVANDMIEFNGYLSVGSCWAQAVINAFVWPSVFSD